MRCALALLLVVVACKKGDPGDDTAPTTATATGTGTGSTLTTGDGQPWFCSNATPAVTDLGNGYQQVDTDHYALQLAVTPERAEELGHFAEAAYLAMADRFGAEPSEPVLEVVLYPDRTSFEQAILDDGLTPPAGAGGYYHTSTKQVYALVPPTQYYEDVIVLHEMIHQFQYLANTGNQGIPTWYAEGIAEAWSRHDWDDGCIRMGRIPLLSQEDYYGIARTELETSGLDLPAIVSESVVPSRAAAMAVVQYLHTTDPDGFAAFRGEMDAHTADPTGAFQTHLGDPGTVGDAVVDWISDHQEPMNPVYLEWIHRSPDAVESLFVDGVLSMTLAKEPGDLSATVVPGTDLWIAGMLIAYDDGSNYAVALVDPYGSVSVFDVIGGTVDWYSIGSVTPPGSDPATFELTHSGSSVEFAVNGEVVSHSVVQTPARGLAVYGSNLRFEDIELNTPQ